MRIYCKLSTVAKVVVAALVTGMVLGGGATHAMETPAGHAGAPVGAVSVQR